MEVPISRRQILLSLRSISLPASLPILEACSQRQKGGIDTCAISLSGTGEAQYCPSKDSPSPLTCQFYSLFSRFPILGINACLCPTHAFAQVEFFVSLRVIDDICWIGG